jgi:hypothetical protein
MDAINNNQTIDNNLHDGIIGNATNDGALVDLDQSTLDPTKAALLKLDNSVLGLVVLCHGLKNESGEDLIDINVDPWKTMPRESVKPKAKMFQDEVMRRHDAFNLNSPKPRTKNWPVEKCQKWLSDNPITNMEEIEFLKDKIQQHTVAQDEANAAKQLEMAATETSERSWVGRYPYLRLIHCIIDDDAIKRAFLKRYDIDSSRIALDGRNSDTRQPTAFEMIAAKWNDPTFEPETEAMDDLHPDYVSSEKLTFDLVADMAQATSIRVKDKLQSLNVALTRVVTMWERSGQGDGGRIIDDDESVRMINHPQFGSLRDRDRGALSSRASFVQNHQSYLLYFWEQMEKHDLLRTSFQKLNDETASIDGGLSVPSATSHPADRELRSASKNGKYFEQLTSSIAELASKNLQAAEISAEERRKDRELREQAMMLEMEEKSKDRIEKQRDREQRGYLAEVERKFQEKSELKRRLDHLFEEKRKVQRLNAEYTFGEHKNKGLAAYYKKEVEQIETAEEELNEQLELLNCLPNSS